MQTFNLSEIARNSNGHGFCEQCGGFMSHSVHILPPLPGTVVIVKWDECIVCRDWVHAWSSPKNIDGSRFEMPNEFEALKPQKGNDDEQSNN
jgi:hypothetical protein